MLIIFLLSFSITDAHFKLLIYENRGSLLVIGWIPALKRKAQQQACALCGRVIKSKAIKQKVGGTYFIFDKGECAIILKRLHSVYGDDFCAMLKG